MQSSLCFVFPNKKLPYVNNNAIKSMLAQNLLSQPNFCLSQQEITLCKQKCNQVYVSTKSIESAKFLTLSASVNQMQALFNQLQIWAFMENFHYIPSSCRQLNYPETKLLQRMKLAKCADKYPGQGTIFLSILQTINTTTFLVPIMQTKL